MSDVKWIKITTTMFDDEKIKLIESMPEKDTILVVWIKLLALCGRCNRDGRILLSGDIAYNEEMLASIFNRPVSSIRLAIDTYKALKMIEIEEGIIEISNWSKHQNIEGLDKIREQNRKRVQKYRQTHIDNIESNSNIDCNTSIKQNKNKNKRGNVSVTLRNVTDIHTFIIPTINDVTAYCTERNNNVNPQKFIDFYTAKGWMIGKNKVKDWKACVRTWESSTSSNVTERKWNDLNARPS